MIENLNNSFLNEVILNRYLQFF